MGRSQPLINGAVRFRRARKSVNSIASWVKVQADVRGMPVAMRCMGMRPHRPLGAAEKEPLADARETVTVSSAGDGRGNEGPCQVRSLCEEQCTAALVQVRTDDPGSVSVECHCSLASVRVYPPGVDLPGVRQYIVSY